MVRCFMAWLRLLLRGGGVDALPGRSTGAVAAGRGSSKSATCWPACAFAQKSIFSYRLPVNWRLESAPN